jgi:hypothetical protein
MPDKSSKKRIECECGRMVRIDPETMEGDRAICPYCGAKLVLPAQEEAPAGQQVASEKGPNMALLVAAGVLAVLLAGGGLTAFLLLKKDKPIKEIAPSKPVSQQATEEEQPTPKPTAKAQPKPSDPLAGPFAIRLMAPRKKGDLRTVRVNGTTTTRFTVVEGGKAEPEPLKNTKCELTCKIHTLEVDESGHEKAWEFTIDGIKIQGPAATTLPAPGTVVRAQLAAMDSRNELIFSGPNADQLAAPVRTLLARATGRRLGYWYMADDDATLGTAELARVESGWLANEEALNKWYTGMSDIVWDTASAKLAAVAKDAKPPFAKVNVALEAKGKIIDKTPAGIVPVGAATNELTGKVTYHLPLTNFQGPTLVATHFEVLTKDAGKDNVGSEEFVEETFTLDIEYQTPLQ